MLAIKYALIGVPVLNKKIHSCSTFKNILMSWYLVILQYEETLYVGFGGKEKLGKSHLQVDVAPKLTQKP